MGQRRRKGKVLENPNKKKEEKDCREKVPNAGKGSRILCLRAGEERRKRRNLNPISQEKERHQ